MLAAELKRIVEEISERFPVHFIQDDDFDGEGFQIEEKKSGFVVRHSNVQMGVYAGSKILSEGISLGLKKAHSKWRVIYPKKVELSDPFLVSLARLGFNGVVVEDPADCKRVQAWGLKVILKPEPHQNLISPFDSHFSPLLKEHVENFSCCFDALFWESPYVKLDCKKWLLEGCKLPWELFLEEMSQIEKLTPLFYSFPENCLNERHFKLLEKHAAPTTFLVFSSSGSPYFSLCQSQSIPNVQGIDLKGPFIALENVRRFLGRVATGAMIELGHQWKQGDFLDCSLLLASEALFNGTVFEETMTKWLQRNHKELSMPKWREFMRRLEAFSSKADQLKKAKGSIAREEEKMMAEILYNESKLYEREIEREKTEGLKSYLSEVRLYLSNTIEGLDRLT